MKFKDVLNCYANRLLNGLKSHIAIELTMTVD